MKFNFILILCCFTVIFSCQTLDKKASDSISDYMYKTKKPIKYRVYKSPGKPDIILKQISKETSDGFLEYEFLWLDEDSLAFSSSIERHDLNNGEMTLIEQSLYEKSTSITGTDKIKAKILRNSYFSINNSENSNLELEFTLDRGYTLIMNLKSSIKHEQKIIEEL